MYGLVCPITSSEQHHNQQRKRLDNCIMVESLWLLLATHLAVPHVLRLPLSHAYTLPPCASVLLPTSVQCAYVHMYALPVCY